MHTAYTRIFDGADGETHFEDVTLELAERDFAPPAAPAHVAPFLEARGTLFFAASPSWGGETPHPTPQRQIFVILKGQVDATASDGERRRFGPGEPVVLDDTHGKGHSSNVAGSEDLVIFGAVLADQTPHPGPS